MNFETGIAFIAEDMAKPRRGPRPVTLPPNAIAWLRIGCELPVVNWQTRWDAVRKACGLPDDWPQNVMRHSFASYHYALHRSADLTSSEMGNTPDMLFRHYREITSRNEAERFFSIIL